MNHNLKTLALGTVLCTTLLSMASCGDELPDPIMLPRTLVDIHTDWSGIDAQQRPQQYVLSVNGDNYTVASDTYQMELKSNCNYTFLAYVPVLGVDVNDGIATVKAASHSTGNYVEAIVLPNIDGNDAATRNIEFEHNGKVYKAAISADVKFESGKKYVYNVTFTANGAVKIEGAGVTNWEEVTGDDVVVVPGGEAQYHFNNVYAVGDATPNGWEIDKSVKFDKVDDNTYTATFALKEGEMKFPLSINSGFECDYIMPTENGVGLSHSACMLVKYPDERDYKWKVSADEAGTYTIVLDVKKMTMTATKSE